MTDSLKDLIRGELERAEELVWVTARENFSLERNSESIQHFADILDAAENAPDSVTYEQFSTACCLQLVAAAYKDLASNHIQKVLETIGTVNYLNGLIHGHLDGKFSAAREAAMRGAMAKLARDPKQAAKAKAKELWRDWQAARTLHKGQAAFARYVVQCLPVIESTESVNRWVREWRAEAGQ